MPFRYLPLASANAGAFVIAGIVPQAFAMDFTQGLTTAVPVKNGQAPKIDGDLSDWDTSASEPVWIAQQTARDVNADWTVMYDEDALYLSAVVQMPGRPMHNPNNPQDGFWWGDLVQIRLASDPALPYPLNRDMKSDRIAHISLWRNTDTGQDYMHIAYGARLNQGSVVNPPGSSVVFKLNGSINYTVEARVPWAALNVPSGKNPFKPGTKMPAIFETLWKGGDSTRVASNHRVNPGTFAFQQTHAWGQVEFAASGLGKRRRPTIAQLVSQFEKEAAQAPAVGVPITIKVPKAAKLSVNILGPNGEILRELVGGRPVEAGEFTTHWDGKDAWGKSLPPGEYRWGAYFSGGLKAKFFGGVGKSGEPYWNTTDGKGGWGADHSDPLDCAADSSGLYFLWPVAEAGKALVKTDYQGKVIWRKTPFVGGGFGPFHGVATNGDKVFLIIGDLKPRLVRLQAATGQLEVWSEGGSAELPLGEFKQVPVPATASPFTALVPEDKRILQPEVSGLAASATEVYIPSYSQNKILVYSTTGKPIRTLDLPGPRGVNLDATGNLYAVSYVPGKPAAVVRFERADGPAQPVITNKLEAPWDVAVDADGQLYVTDLGKSQQVKVFSATGKLVSARGKAGGRAWMGKYDSGAFLRPAGIATDPQGGLLVAESSIPKVVSRFEARSGKNLGRWFGAPVYWTANFPSPRDPQDIFYPLNQGLGRARIAKEGTNALPEAYIAPREAGFLHSSDFEHRINHPEILVAQSGKTILLSDATPHTIGVLEKDIYRPAAHFRTVNKNNKENKTGKAYLEVWRDANGDGQIQENELTIVDTVQGAPLVNMAELTSSMHMEPNGDLYFMTAANSVLKIPASGFGKDGMPNWDLNAAYYVIPSVLPSKKSDMSTTWRHGLLGTRVDKAGNLYVNFNTSVAGSGGEYDFATPEMARTMKEGLGHTATFNVVKMAKYNPQGQLLWMAGRKATAAAKDGQLFHFWNMAGLVNEKYIAGASEWGQIYFFTHDGFYVDALMNNPGLNPPPGPYTFGGETSGGRVQYYPDRDELWAYVSGMAYKVEGFKNGAVEGEARVFGNVKLDKEYDTAASSSAAGPLQLVPVNGNPLQNAALWESIPETKLVKNDENLGAARLAYDDANLYVRILVNDSTPLQNAADTLATAFKGGDSAALVLGPAAANGNRSTAGAGDLRLLATVLQGKPQLVAMKAVTSGQQKPEVYFTPAAGEVKFQYVGEVPESSVKVGAAPGGYVAQFSVPRSFLEVQLQPGSKLVGDIELRLSGNGQRGVQTTGRKYLFTPATPATTMVDDLPTEARLYPQFWGQLEVK